MTSISDMDLPDEVVDKTIEAYQAHGFRAAIRAALQAMVDNGMAKEAHLECGKGLREGIWAANTSWVPRTPCLIIRMDGNG